MSGGVPKVVECLPFKCEASGSNPGPPKEEEGGGGGGGVEEEEERLTLKLARRKLQGSEICCPKMC
jgi:hypothetical protein